MLEFEPAVPSKRSRPSANEFYQDVLHAPSDPWDLKHMRHAVNPVVGDFPKEGKKRIGTIGWRNIPDDVKDIIRDLVITRQATVFDQPDNERRPFYRWIGVDKYLPVDCVRRISLSWYWAVYNCGGPSDKSECRTKAEHRAVVHSMEEETSLVWILKYKLQRLDLLSIDAFHRPKLRSAMIVLREPNTSRADRVYGDKVLCNECWRHEQNLFHRDQDKAVSLYQQLAYSQAPPASPADVAPRLPAACNMHWDNISCEDFHGMLNGIGLRQDDEIEPYLLPEGVGPATITKRGHAIAMRRQS